MTTEVQAADTSFAMSLVQGQIWIEPDGQVHDISSENKTHGEWALDYLGKQQPASEEDTDDARWAAQDELLTMGWMRMGTFMRLGAPQTYLQVNGFLNKHFLDIAQRWLHAHPDWIGPEITIDAQASYKTMAMQDFLALNNPTEIRRWAKRATGIYDGYCPICGVRGCGGRCAGPLGRTAAGPIPVPEELENRVFDAIYGHIKDYWSKIDGPVGAERQTQIAVAMKDAKKVHGQPVPYLYVTPTTIDGRGGVLLGAFMVDGRVPEVTIQFNGRSTGPEMLEALQGMPGLKLRGWIRHELAHVFDRIPKDTPGHEPWENPLGYFNDPVEVRAYASQVYRYIMDSWEYYGTGRSWIKQTGEKGLWETIGSALGGPTRDKLQKFLTPANRRYVLQVTYRAIMEAIERVEKLDAGKAVAARLKPLLRTANDRARKVAAAIIARSTQWDTPEFKAWFQGSVTVNPDGTPMLFYHGTSKDKHFDKFKAGLRGIFFTKSPEAASDYAVENDSQNLKYNPDTRRYDALNTHSRVIPVYLRIRKPYVFTEQEAESYKHAENYAKWQRELGSKILSGGYDGVIYPDGSYVVFDPTQIKSAIGNSGAFDPKNQKITASIMIEASKTLYHGTTVERAKSIMRYGLTPDVGDLVQMAYGDEAPGYDFEELTFAADKPDVRNSVLSAILHAISAEGHPVDDRVQAIRNWGAVVVIKEGEDVMDHRPETDNPHDYTDYPLQVEPGDYFSRDSVDVDSVITGMALVRWLQRNGAALHGPTDTIPKYLRDQLVGWVHRVHPEAPMEEVVKRVTNLPGLDFRKSYDYYKKQVSQQGKAAAWVPPTWERSKWVKCTPKAYERAKKRLEGLKFPLTLYRAVKLVDEEALRSHGVGIYWTDQLDRARFYTPAGRRAPGEAYVLRAQVTEDMIDWDSTFWANLEPYGNSGIKEQEIKLNAGTPVHVDGILRPGDTEFQSRSIAATASKKDNPEADAETERIRERSKTPEAQRPHKFQAAEWTHPNGHPRCKVCGDEEPEDGICKGSKTAATDPQLKATLQKLRPILREWVAGGWHDGPQLMRLLEKHKDLLAQFRPTQPLRLWRNERVEGPGGGPGSGSLNNHGWEDQYTRPTAWSTNRADAETYASGAGRRLVTAIVPPEDMYVSVPMVDQVARQQGWKTFDPLAQSEVIVRPNPSILSQIRPPVKYTREQETQIREQLLEKLRAFYAPQVKKMQEAKPEGAQGIAQRADEQIRSMVNGIKTEELPERVKEWEGKLREWSKTAAVPSLDTDAFKAWFKNSVVVDNEGNPLVVVHQTSSDFTTFRKKFLGDNTAENASDKWYFETSKVGFWFTDKGAPNLHLFPGDRQMPVYLSMQNPVVYPTLDYLANALEWNRWSGSKFRSAMEAKGYDGLIIRKDEETKATSYVAFQSNQIKSVANVGTFDPKKQSIMAKTASQTTIGMNINDSQAPWTQMILQGVKTIETRDSDSLRPHVGERVGIVRTGDGPAMLVGYADLGEPKVYRTTQEWQADARRHRVGGELAPGAVKYGYPLTNVEAVNPPQPVTGQGRVFRRLASTGPRAWIDPQGKVHNTEHAAHEDWALRHLNEVEPGEWTGGAPDMAQGSLLGQGWARVGALADLQGPILYGEAERWTPTTFRAFQRAVMETPEWQTQRVEIGRYPAHAMQCTLDEFLAAKSADSLLRGRGITAATLDPQADDPGLLTKEQYLERQNPGERFHPSEAYDWDLEQMNKDNSGHWIGEDSDKMEFSCYRYPKGFVIREGKALVGVSDGHTLWIKHPLTSLPTTYWDRRPEGYTTVDFGHPVQVKYPAEYLGKVTSSEMKIDQKYPKLLQTLPQGYQLRATNDTPRADLALVHNGLIVGVAQDEWGATLISVAEEYRGRGVGNVLHKAWYSRHPGYTSGGYTSAGQQMAIQGWSDRVRELLAHGVYSKLVADGKMTREQVAAILKGLRNRSKGLSSPEQQTTAQADLRVFVDPGGIHFIVYDAAFLQDQDPKFIKAYGFMRDSEHVGVFFYRLDYEPAYRTLATSIALQMAKNDDTPLYVGQGYGDLLEIEDQPVQREGNYVSLTKDILDLWTLAKQERTARKAVDRYGEIENLLQEGAEDKNWDEAARASL